MSKHQKKNASTAVLLTSGLVGLTTVVGSGLASSIVSAEGDSTTANASVTVPVSCIMSGTVNTAHNATISPGTYSGASGSEYENGIGKTTLTAYCNDDNGFSIYAIGFTGDSYDSENHTKLVGTNASGNATISTKVYASSDTQSNWSMKVTKVTDSAQSYNPANMSIINSFDSWHEVPSTYTKVAQYKATTGSSTTDQGLGALGAKVETTYAAYIAPTQSADTYTGQVKYTMVHPYTEEPLQPQTATAGCINYFANASNAVGTMGCQSESSEDGYSYHTIADGGSATLLASNFSRTGYGFAGWSDSFDYATNPNAKFYGPQETITVPTGTTANGLSLYAVWVKSEGSIQDSTKVSEVCNRLTTAPTNDTANLSSVSALTDQRDNQTYAIAKLADGKCWMIENLRLDNTASLTLANTNNPLNDGTNVTLKHNYSDTETYNTLSASQDPTATAWCLSNSVSCDNQSMLFTGNTANRKTDSANNDGNIYSYGNYYNWYSATAGRGTYGFSTSNSSVAGDLCPAGWHLPKGGGKSNEANNEFWSLVVTGINNGTNPANYESSTTPYYTGTPEGTDASNKLRAYPNNFVYSGRVDSGSVYNRGSAGLFWSSTAGSSYYAYILDLGSSLVRPGTTSSNKFFGWAVRCVAPGV